MKKKLIKREWIPMSQINLMESIMVAKQMIKKANKNFEIMFELCKLKYLRMKGKRFVLYFICFNLSINFISSHWRLLNWSIMILKQEKDSSKYCESSNQKVNTNQVISQVMAKFFIDIEYYSIDYRVEPEPIHRHEGMLYDEPE